METFAAVVLTGGTGARLGGADKATLEYAGRPLLEHALAAVAGAAETVVVGEPATTSRAVTFTREDPPRGGPAAGILAGRDVLETEPEWLVVLAVDMPLVGATTVARLLEAADGHDGAFLTGSGGRWQLAGVLDVPALDRARPQDAHGLAVHRLLQPLDVVAVPARGGESRDVDTWADLRDLPDRSEDPTA
jgi:molybdopterin-guanine dinucleotide biosynthesis protein A